jgi:hypothetical protein
MKQLFPILAVLAFLSCKEKRVEKKQIDYRGFTERQITLVGYDKEAAEWNDTLGDLTLKLPVRLDSFYQWHVTSDCIGCGEVQYRFADKGYQHFLEGGFIWSNKRPDSIYQFTIQHNPITYTPDSIKMPITTLADTSQWSYFPHYANCSSDVVQFLRKDYLIINGKVFITATFIAKVGPITKKETLLVIASTAIKKREYLNFIGECSAKDTAGFVESMYKSFGSIQINERP